MFSLLASKNQTNKIKKTFQNNDVLVVNFADKIAFFINKWTKFSHLVNFASQLYTYID